MKLSLVIRVILILHVFVILHYCTGDSVRVDDYEIVQDHLIIYDYNKTRLQDPKAVVYKYNDSLRMKAINVSGYFLYDVFEKAIVNFMVYKYVNDDYRIFPVNVTFDICEEYKKLGQLGTTNPFGIKTALKLSNFRGCPFHKNTLYHLNNWVLEQDKFPPHLPPGKYSLRINCYVENEHIFAFDGAWFGEVAARKVPKKRRRPQKN